MAQDRLTLQETLLEMAPKAWYKRPPDNKMTYPCFLYRLSRPDVKHADNRVYAYKPCYNVIYISREPSDLVVRQMLERFEYCSFDREYQTDGLFHYSFVLYWTGYDPSMGPVGIDSITDPEIHDLFDDNEQGG